MNTESTKNLTNFDSTINVTVTDYVLTPLTCASLVTEIFKNLLYQKGQIPYPYAWLKNVVTKKRRSLEEGSSDKRINFMLYKYFQTVSSSYDAMENISSNIINQFRQSPDKVKEIMFVFGVTPVCPLEVYTVRISSLAWGHYERNHVMESNKKQLKTMRDIFLSQNWMGLLDNALACTNMYVFLKICGVANDFGGDNIFIPSRALQFPPKVRNIVINLNYVDNLLCSCCDKLEVFQDVCDTESSIKVKHVEADGCSNETTWFQSKISLQGFKDRFINKVSACELW